MIVLLLALAALILWKAEVCSDLREDYLSKEQTTAIRGILACIIFCSHLRDYLPLDGAGDGSYLWILRQIGQNMVAPFFFCSGYGIVLSYQKKKNYGQGFLRKRLLTTWIHFAVAVGLFFVMDLLLIHRFSFGEFLLALTGWGSVGNSNWFMFDTFLFYLLAWAGMKFCDRFGAEDGSRPALLVTVLGLGTAAMIPALSRVQSSWWFDTLLSFAFGGFFVLIQPNLNRFCREKCNYFVFGAAALLLYRLFHRAGGYAAYNVASCLFTLLIVCLTMRVRIGNPVLLWLGKHSFYIYIDMRIPMILLHHFDLLTGQKFLFAGACFALTCALAWTMNRFHGKTDSCFLPKAGKH